MFQCKTIYQAQAATGYRITFSTGRLLVQGVSRGGTFWIRPYEAGVTPSGSVPTSPVPSAGQTAEWIRIGDTETFTLGSRSHGSPMTGTLDVWCEDTGDLVVVAE